MMNEQTHQFSDLIPGDSNFLKGEYQIDAPFSIQCTDAAVLGDMFRASLSLEAALGNIEYNMLGTDDCFVEWGAYDLCGSMSMSATATPLI